MVPEYITTKAEYNRVANRIEELQKSELSKEEALELRNLVRLIVAYEKLGKYLFAGIKALPALYLTAGY
jgi:hypothetical protein